MAKHGDIMTTRSAAPAGWLRPAARFALVFAGYLLAAVACSMWHSRLTGVPLLLPQTGLSLWVLCRYGCSMAIPLAAAEAAYLFVYPASGAFAPALTGIAGPLLGAYLFRVIRTHRESHSLHPLFAAVTATSLVLPAGTALSGTATMASTAIPFLVAAVSLLLIFPLPGALMSLKQGMMKTAELILLSFLCAAAAVAAYLPPAQIMPLFVMAAALPLPFILVRRYGRGAAVPLAVYAMTALYGASNHPPALGMDASTGTAALLSHILSLTLTGFYASSLATGAMRGRPGPGNGDSFIITTEENMRLAMDAAKMGIWELRMADSTMFISDNIEEVVGLEPPFFSGHYSGFLDLIHPDDRDEVRGTINAALSDRADELFYLEYRLLGKDSSYRWLQSKGRVQRDAAGAPVRIIGTLSDMTLKKRTEEYLRMSEKKFQQVFQESPIAISLHLMDGKFIEANRAFSDLTGYTHEEIKSLAFRDISHPDDLEQEMPLYHACLRGEIRQYTVDKRYRKKNGEYLVVKMTAAVIEDESSLPLYVLNMALDVTEQKEQEEKIQRSLMEKSLLLKEIHHRVKNNMQIISSILSLQTHNLTDEIVLGLFNDCQNRVHSMALVHEKLYQSGDMTRIDFGEYIQELVEHLFHTYTMMQGRINTTIEINNIYLGIDTAIPAALIINELVSNAMKYAFPGRERGTIRVRMEVMGGGGYSLIVADDGVGLPENFEMCSVGTLGLQLVSALTGQLKGKLNIARDGGTIFSIFFN